MAVQVPVDALKALAFERTERLQLEGDIKDDITPIFYKGLRQKLQKGETIIVSITAQTRKGKSVLGCHLVNAINNMIIDLGLVNSMLNKKMEDLKDGE
jgi:hypothetical protein